MSVPTTLVWFRQDLRTDDQPALQAAARSGRPLLGLYVWPNEGMLTARRRYFIWQSLRDLQARQKLGQLPPGGGFAAGNGEHGAGDGRQRGGFQIFR